MTSPRYVVESVRFGPFPFVVVDTSRDVIVKACATADDAADTADAMEWGTA